MKKIQQPTTIFEGITYLLEPGDRLHFRVGKYSRTDWEGPLEFDITVRGTILQSRFGERILSVEKIRAIPEEDVEQYPEIAYHDEFYLRDEWEITVISDENTV